MLEGELNLIKSAKQGDSSSFGVLYNHYLAQIYRFIYLKVTSKHEAEDLSHEVFLSAWQNLPSYADKGFPFSSWLYQIARNKVIDHLRTKKPVASLEVISEENLELASITDAELDNALSVSMVKEAMRQLSDDHQNVLIMRFVEDMAPAQIAEAIGKSEGAVRLMQHRAILRLRDILKEAHEENGPATIV